MLDDQVYDDLVYDYTGQQRRPRRGSLQNYDPEPDANSEGRFEMPGYEPEGGGGEREASPAPQMSDTNALAANTSAYIPNQNTGITGMASAEAFGNGAGGSQGGTFVPIQGFDFDKLSGKKPYDSADKYSDAVRAFSQMMGAGVVPSRNNLGASVDWLRANGFGGAKAVGDDKIDFGDGAGPIDIITSDGQIWFQNGADRFAGGSGAGGGTGAGGGAGAGAGGAGGGAGGGVGQTGGDYASPSPLDDLIRQMLERQRQNDEFNKQVRSGLLRNINDANTPVDENDPIMSAQRRAFQGEQDRAMAQAREVLAARAQYGGAPTGQLDAGVQSLIESGMNARGSHSASLMGERYKQKLSQLQNALQMGAGVLNADETRDLQASIAAIESRLRELGLKQGDDHFYDQLQYLIGNTQSGIDRWLMEYMGR